MAADQREQSGHDQYGAKRVEQDLAPRKHGDLCVGASAHPQLCILACIGLGQRDRCAQRPVRSARRNRHRCDDLHDTCPQIGLYGFRGSATGSGNGERGNSENQRWKHRIPPRCGSRTGQYTAGRDAIGYTMPGGGQRQHLVLHDAGREPRLLRHSQLFPARVCRLHDRAGPIPRRHYGARSPALHWRRRRDGRGLIRHHARRAPTPSMGGRGQNRGACAAIRLPARNVMPRLCIRRRIRQGNQTMPSASRLSMTARLSASLTSANRTVSPAARSDSSCTPWASPIGSAPTARLVCAGRSLPQTV